jgi:hypothetical protein
MVARKTVLLIGIDPNVLDFSLPDFAHVPELDAAKLTAALKADENRLHEVGYEPEQLFIDLGKTAETVLRAKLAQKHFDVVLVGAGIRTLPSVFLLFEKVINVVHAHAVGSKICFNTGPSDSVEAVARWVH